MEGGEGEKEHHKSTTIFSAMSSIGGFCETEINGKPFSIFTLLSLKDNPSPSSGEIAIDSGDDNDHSLQPLFLCPTLRVEAERLKRKENGYSSVDEDENILPFNTSPHFPNIRSRVDQQVQSLLDSDNDDDDICKLPLLPLFWCNNKEPYDDEDFNCPSCQSPEIGTGYYLCPTCNEVFHKECVEAPLEIKHPSFPFLSLQLYTLSCHLIDKSWSCISCENPLYDLLAYHCPTYNLSMHQVCLMKPIPILIDHSKRHPHSLTFFPKQNSLICNVCGVVDLLFPTYVCARCIFVVHQDCIYFPYVIRISRHQHRISFSYSLPSGALSCGVCRKKVDNDCGAYSCNKCDDYFVHSRCAVRKDLWDGEELEGVPEEPDEIVVEPFERIADGIILHFSHGHHLKLEMDRVYDEYKYCQACILPIYEGNYYSCVDHCDFILHETCAYSPLKRSHPLHARSLTLKVVPAGYKRNQGHFGCDACLRESCGFVYEDSTRDRGFKLDLRCASISEPFKYEGHEHPLFLALTREEEKSTICQICQDTAIMAYCRKLNCIKCDYIICFKCATLPYKARYKHDKHLLTFRKLKETSDQSGWCEVCEQKIVYLNDYGFYSCDEYCCTTLHVDCLLGKSPYMKPGQTIYIHREEFHTFPNNTMSRPLCHGRKCDRCLYKVVLQKNNILFCSYYCAFIERYA